MDAFNISAFAVSIITLSVVFVKTIKKCKCNKSGLVIERRDESGIEEQHGFILQMVKLLKNFTPRRSKNPSSPCIENSQPSSSGGDIEIASPEPICEEKHIKIPPLKTSDIALKHPQPIHLDKEQPPSMVGYERAPELVSITVHREKAGP
jgi:hypothetical protein